jgi:hypothetical protein
MLPFNPNNYGTLEARYQFEEEKPNPLDESDINSAAHSENQSFSLDPKLKKQNKRKHKKNNSFHKS